MTDQIAQAADAAEAAKTAQAAEPAKAKRQPLTMKAVRKACSSWTAQHNGVFCVCIALVVFVALAGLFCFVVFSDFGGSADFIYNQF